MGSNPPEQQADKPKEAAPESSVPSFKVKAWSGADEEMTLKRLITIFKGYQRKLVQIQSKIKNLSVAQAQPQVSPGVQDQPQVTSGAQTQMQVTPEVPTQLQTPSKPAPNPEQFTKPLEFLSKKITDVKAQIKEANNVKNEETLKNAYAFFLKKSASILVIMFKSMENLGMSLPPNRPTFKRIKRARLVQQTNAAPALVPEAGAQAIAAGPGTAEGPEIAAAQRAVLMPEIPEVQRTVLMPEIAATSGVATAPQISEAPLEVVITEQNVSEPAEPAATKVTEPNETATSAATATAGAKEIETPEAPKIQTSQSPEPQVQTPETPTKPVQSQ